MPITKQAEKRMRADKKRHVRNVQAHSELKSRTKKFLELMSSKKIDEARKEAMALIKKISNAGSKGIIHKRTASRKTSRLMKRLSKA